MCVNEERYRELSHNLDLHLTMEEINDGWHFCMDWDGLLIHEDDPEAECCTCQ